MPQPFGSDLPATLTILPELPEIPPANLVLFSSTQWNGLKVWLRAIYLAQDAVLTVIAPLSNGVEGLLPLKAQMEMLMTMSEQFNSALERNTASTDAATAATAANTEAVASQIRDLQTAKDSLAAKIAELEANQPITQAQLDGLTADSDRIDGVVSALTASNAALAADDEVVADPEPA